MTKKARTVKVNKKEMASKILRTVPHNEAFHFFTDIGQYSGQFAASLAEFCQKVETIDIESVNFHFKRQDFEKWIRETIGDVDLANEINEIKKSIQGEELRVKIYQTVERRLTELKKLLASEEVYCSTKKEHKLVSSKHSKGQCASIYISSTGQKST